MLEINQEDHEHEKYDLLYQMLKLTIKLTLSKSIGNSLAGQWLDSLHSLQGSSWIPGLGTKTSVLLKTDQKKKKKSHKSVVLAVYKIECSTEGVFQNTGEILLAQLNV